jgi:hypothetical protein
VTGTVWVLPPAVSVTVPLYVLAVRPAGFIETLRFAGVVALAGVTLSQLPPLLTEAEAVKLTCEFPAVTKTVCAGGTAPPDWKAKLRDPGLAVKLAALDTIRVTGTLNETLLL